MKCARSEGGSGGAGGGFPGAAGVSGAAGGGDGGRFEDEFVCAPCARRLIAPRAEGVCVSIGKPCSGRLG